MSESTLSRRISEFAGVALFALALIWLIALVTYEPTDPVWFFTTDAAHPPANFVGRVGAFLSELSFQLFGYASYLLPAPDRHHRMALLLVPVAGCGLHEGVRRHALLRVRQRLPQPHLRQHRGRRQDLPCRRLDRHVARRRALRLSESDRLHHRAADADGAVGDPVDAVLVRPAVCARQPGVARPLGTRRRWLRRWIDRRRKDRERLRVAAKHGKKGSGIGDQGSGSGIGTGDREDRRPADPRSPIPDPR